LAAGAALAAAPALANVITVTGTTATVTCTPSCEAFTGAGGSTTGPPGTGPTGLGTLSSTDAHLYTGNPAGEANEAARLNTLAGTSFLGTDATRTDPPPALPFSTLALYIVLKVGDAAIYLKNTSGGLLSIDYAGAPGLGLSHVTEFGVIPLPAAFWLMGAGLAGLSFAAPRKKA
jgi:hypothetical protein